MIVNGPSLLNMKPIRDMLCNKVKVHGRSYGLSEVGYDFRMKQPVLFQPPNMLAAMEMYNDTRQATGIRENEAWRRHYERAVYGYTVVTEDDGTKTIKSGRTALASSIEFFHIPTSLWCEFRNKSTNARLYVDAAMGTDGEPGWSGHLTIELVFNGMDAVTFETGTPILKAVFHEIKHLAQYEGKYQNQPDHPVSAILE